MKRKITSISLQALSVMALTLLSYGVKAQTYCSPTFTSGCLIGSNYITNVTLTTLNSNISGCSQSDYTSQSATVTAGASPSMSVSVAGWDGIGVYVDFNNDGDFDDAGEWLYGQYNAISPPQTYNFTITIDPSTIAGNYRMRVACANGWTWGPTDGCITIPPGNDYGSFADYTLTVVNPDCPAFVTQPVSVDVCPGGSATLQASATGSPLPTYQWQFNGVDIPGATDTTLILTNLSSGDVGSYTLVATNGCGFSISDAANIALKPAPVSDITAMGPTSFCPGDSVKLVADNSSTATYQWQRNGSNLNSYTDTMYVTSVPGDYTVITTGTNGCATLSSPVTVSNYPTPAAAAISPSGTVKLCLGGTQLLTIPSEPGITYQWKINNINIGGATDTAYTATNSGLFTVVSTNSYNCSTAAPATNVLFSTPATVSVTTAGSYVLCQGSSKMLHAVSPDTASEYQWQLNGVDIPNATGPTYWANAAGNYSVIDFNGCYATSASLSLVSNPFPTIIPSGATTFCAGGSVLLNSSINTSANGITYQWIKNGSPIANATGVSYLTNSAGTYTMVVTSDSTCTAMSTPVTVTVNSIPHPNIVTSPNSYELFTDGVYDVYQWLYENNPIPGATGYSYTDEQNGHYSVIVTDDNGCTGTSVMYNEVRHPVSVPNVSIKDNIKVYPNPASTVLNIESPVKINVAITSIDGKTVMTANDAASINISSLATGTYLLKIYDQQGNFIKTEKIVKAAL